MSQQNKVSINEKLLKIRQDLLAGKVGLEESSITHLCENFNSLIKDCSKIISIFDEEISANILLEIFELLPTSQLVEEITNNLDKNDYYDFGMVLLQLLTKEKLHLASPLTHEYLNTIRHKNFLKKISRDKNWEELISKLISASNYNIDALFNQRVRDYSSKVLFKVILGNKIEEYSWKNVAENVNKYSENLKNILSEYKAKEIHVAFLMENSLDMAMLDISCLTSGIVNVMIPANSVSEHISFILNQTKVPLLITSDEKQLSKIKAIKKEIPNLQKVILLKGGSVEDWVISFKKFMQDYSSKEPVIYKEINSNKPVDSLATIMYTSGTTGDPKGIMFSYMNIVYKRFCRAMALPEISDKDRYLAFLPLYHTFGRYLELFGAIFWGAEYSFMENPSVETMVSNMNLVKPTIFISIPKKWLQLYEAVSTRVNIELDDEEKIKSAVDEVTGGYLKWGLSAAGFLPPDVFQFFQQYDVHLMSGFGMTEATGGITMTPPMEYSPNSLGTSLPGIEIKLAEDGELLIKGEYVMMGYYGQSFDETFVDDGWLPTGDIMKADEKGFIEIIDRKKEIYKNIKGETIAPQKIENYFRDFENIKQVFLVGDHRAFNTILIFPNYEESQSFYSKMNEEQTKEYFSSVIVTVNNFLAPFERIVDFRIIDRPFSVEKGELTPKGTYKRRIIEANFDNLIESMYQKTHTDIRVGGIEVRLPNWFLREKGCLSRDIESSGNELIISKLNKRLIIELLDKTDRIIKIGSYIYKLSKDYLDLQSVLTNASLWIGNKELLDFTGESIIQWTRSYNTNHDLTFEGKIFKLDEDEYLIEKVKKYIGAKEDSLLGIHSAVLLLQSANLSAALLSLEYLKMIISDDDSPNYNLVQIYFRRPNLADLLDVKRELFKICIQNKQSDDLINIFNHYLNFDHDLINNEIIYSIIENINRDDFFLVLENLFESRLVLIESGEDIQKTSFPSLLKLLSEFGIQRPTAYERLRQVLVSLQLRDDLPQISKLAWQARNELRTGFRDWLGQNQKISVDMETGNEYGWKDVIILEEDILPEDKRLIVKAITETPLLREAIFLFSKGKLIRLSNILPGGVWISHLRTYHNKSVYRVTVQSRYQGSFDVVLNINKMREEKEILDEVNWLIMAGSNILAKDLVEDFGGYWNDHQIWSGKFVAGDRVERVLLRDSRKNDEPALNRLKFLWPFFVWNAAVAYMSYWKLTGYKYVLKDCSIKNFVIPSHDYQTGTKIISISENQNFTTVKDMFDNFYNVFVKSTEGEFPFIQKKKIWNYFFSGVIDAEGEKKGLEILMEYKKEIREEENHKERETILHHLNEFITVIESNKFIPKRLYFAIKRYHRWNDLNIDADLSAQAEMLHELYVTYRLNELEEIYPEVRTRFFLETVFSKSNPIIKEVLNNIVQKFHGKSSSKEEILLHISELQVEYDLTDTEKFFLTRLSYPHLKPTDTADFIKIRSDASHTANLVVQLNDYDGTPFFIRNPITPKEISKLHQLFVEANMLVSFQDKHEFLVAISERGFIIGGLFYFQFDENTVHMEKIVVSNPYRRKGISDKLMNEFFERLKSDNVTNVTTGFFRPEYFYRFGFTVEKKYSGLVKNLMDDKKEG